MLSVGLAFRVQVKHVVVILNASFNNLFTIKVDRIINVFKWFVGEALY